MKKQSVLRILTVLLALCLIGGGIPIPAGAVTQAQIDALKQEAKELNQQKQAIQSKIDALSADIGSNLEKKTLLDQQISITESDIANKEAEIAGYADMITQTEEELETRQVVEALQRQYEIFQAASLVARNALEVNLRVIERAQQDEAAVRQSEAPRQADFRA